MGLVYIVTWILSRRDADGCNGDFLDKMKTTKHKPGPHHSPPPWQLSHLLFQPSLSFFRAVNGSSHYIITHLLIVDNLPSCKHSRTASIGSIESKLIIPLPGSRNVRATILSRGTEPIPSTTPRWWISSAWLSTGKLSSTSSAGEPEMMSLGPPY